jgi:hypothetical protein
VRSSTERRTICCLRGMAATSCTALSMTRLDHTTACRLLYKHDSIVLTEH